MKEQQLVERLDGVSPAEVPEVVRLASELYAQDRAAIEQAEQQRELFRAAAEAGLPLSIWSALPPPSGRGASPRRGLAGAADWVASFCSGSALSCSPG